MKIIEKYYKFLPAFNGLIAGISKLLYNFIVGKDASLYLLIKTMTVGSMCTVGAMFILCAFKPRLIKIVYSANKLYMVIAGVAMTYTSIENFLMA